MPARCTDPRSAPPEVEEETNYVQDPLITSEYEAEFDRVQAPNVTHVHKQLGDANPNEPRKVDVVRIVVAVANVIIIVVVVVVVDILRVDEVWEDD